MFRLLSITISDSLINKLTFLYLVFTIFQ